MIGAPSGLEIVTGAKLSVLGIKKEIDLVTIDFVSPTPDGQHQLQQSVDLKTWQTVTRATFQKTANGVRASVRGATGDVRFYRVSLP